MMLEIVDFPLAKVKAFVRDASGGFVAGFQSRADAELFVAAKRAQWTPANPGEYRHGEPGELLEKPRSAIEEIGSLREAHTFRLVDFAEIPAGMTMRTVNGLDLVNTTGETIHLSNLGYWSRKVEETKPGEPFHALNVNAEVKPDVVIEGPVLTVDSGECSKCGSYLRGSYSPVNGEYLCECGHPFAWPA